MAAAERDAATKARSNAAAAAAMAEKAAAEAKAKIDAEANATIAQAQMRINSNSAVLQICVILLRYFCQTDIQEMRKKENDQRNQDDDAPRILLLPIVILDTRVLFAC